MCIFRDVDEAVLNAYKSQRIFPQHFKFQFFYRNFKDLDSPIQLQEGENNNNQVA